jgi:F-type H+-transporting ATPase subunit b
MVDTTHTTSGTQVPSQQSGAFPPFDTSTYSAQIFWLTVTFVLMLLVMWRLGVKRIGGNIDERKDRIDSDLAAAEGHRQNAQAASADYETALAAARTRAQSLADENHKRMQAEVEDAKAKADADAQIAMGEAEKRISALQAEARRHVGETARDAAVTIVAKLTGDTVSADDAAEAVAVQ